MRRNLFALCLGLCALLLAGAPAACAEYIWLEGEDFDLEIPLKGNGEKSHGKISTEGWGNVSVISGGKLLHVNIASGEVGELVPDTGLVFGRTFKVAAAGEYDIWSRIGYEWARSKFDWRINGGEWRTVSSDEPTIDIQPMQVWNELAWLKLGREGLKAGENRIEFRHLPYKEGEAGKEKFARILHILDAICISSGPFVPYGKWRPETDHRTEKDRQAEEQVYSVNVQAGSDGRAWTELNGLWQYAPWGETEFPISEETRLAPVEKLPELSALRWFSYVAPGARETQMPEQSFTHRYLLRTRIKVPEEASGKGFFLDMQNSSLIVSVFVNGEFAGGTDTFHAPWQMDITPFIKAGEVNDLVLCFKDAYYSLNPVGDENVAQALGNRRYWNVPRNFLSTNQGTASRHDMPVAAAVDSGIIEPLSLVMAGAVYSEDIFVKPTEGSLGLEVTLFNPTRKPQEIELANSVIPWNEGRGGPAECVFSPQTLTLAPGQSQTLEIKQTWAEPTRWWPDNPYLYWVETAVKINGKITDLKRTRFGFRTIDWSTDQFLINGVKWTMWADISAHGKDPREQVRISREQSNANQMRYWHAAGLGGMTRRQAMNYFDETGLLVRSSGTFDGQVANYGGGLRERDAEGKLVAKRQLWDAWRKQMTAWIRAERNHPSIYIWSIENEIAYINVANLGQWRECEPELTKGAQHVMKLDPTRPAMVDGGNCLRDESLPVNGAHYTEFMNVDFRDFPDAAYTKEHFYDKDRPQRGAWRIVPGRPIMGGEIYFAEGYSGARLATIGGDICFLGIGQTMEARDLWAKMLSEGYRWCEYGSFHFWLGGSGRNYWNSWKPVAVFCRQWNWSWGAGSKIKRTLKVFNTTSDPSPIDVTWQFELAGQKVAGATTTFNVPCGEAEEFDVEFAVPEVKEPTAGAFAVSASRADKEVYREEKPVRVLAPAQTASPKIAAGKLALFDPAGLIAPFLAKRGVPFTTIESADAITNDTEMIIVGTDAITADMSGDLRWQALAAAGKKVLVLDQEYPLAYRAIPADLAPTRFTGRFGFAEDLTHPAFRGMVQEDFFTWGNDHVLYRNAYRKGTRGGRSLLQCDNELGYTALFESQLNDGLLMLCQLRIGAKLADEAVAQQMLLNLLEYVAAYKPVRKEAVTLLPEDDQRLKVLERIDLSYTPVVSALEALQKGGVAIVDASAHNLRQLAENGAKVEEFTRNGGWLILWGLQPEGLEDFNRLVGYEHVLREFQSERVLLSYPADRLASGLTLRDVVMDTGKKMYPWMALNTPAKDSFDWLVDHTDIAPFCKFPDGLAMGKESANPGTDHEPRNMVNGFTSDDNWAFTYTTLLDRGHKTRFVLELPKEEELVSLRIRPSKLYHPITKMNIYFDDDPEPVTAEIPVREQPVVEDIPIPGRKARRITLEIAGWAERGENNVVVIDNIWLMVKRPQEYLQRVSSLLNVGALMACRNGTGGIFLNQIRVLDNETNPDNVGKKADILKTILANMGAIFKGGEVMVESTRYVYSPVSIPDSRFNTYKDQNGQPQWFANGDIAAIPVGERTFAGINFRLSDFSTSPVPSVFTLAGAGSRISDTAIKGIEIGAKADVFVFLHTFNPGSGIESWLKGREDDARRRRPLRTPPQVAAYRINYADGSSEDVKVVFGEHIGAWNTTQPGPLPEADLGWTGNQASGENASVWVMRWRNPYPEKSIASVDFMRSGNNNLGAPALLAITTGQEIKE